MPFKTYSLENRHCSVLPLFHIIFPICSYYSIIPSKCREHLTITRTRLLSTGAASPVRGGIYICLLRTTTQRSRCFKSPRPCAFWQLSLTLAKARDLNRGTQSTPVPYNLRFPTRALRNSRGSPELSAPLRTRRAGLLLGGHSEMERLGCRETETGPRAPPTIYSLSKLRTN